MNWTGGSLQRTKNANKGILQKQKAYFAKARTQLQNNSNRSTANFRPSYLDEDEYYDLTRRVPTGRAASFHQSGHSLRRQTGQIQQPMSRKDKLSKHYDGSPLRMSHDRSAPQKAEHSNAKGEKISMSALSTFPSTIEM